jgi:hypothetical protein
MRMVGSGCATTALAKACGPLAFGAVSLDYLVAFEVKIVRAAPKSRKRDTILYLSNKPLPPDHGL